MPEQLEIERKFLLKKLPQNVEILALKFTNVIRYYSNKHEKVSQESGKHLLIRKSEIDGQRIRKEIIHEINPRDFKNFVENQATRKVEKIRYFITDNGTSWQIDDFQNIKLVMAECEILVPEEEKLQGIKVINSISLPSFISNNLIIEVSDSSEFSNFELASPFHYDRS